MAIDFVLFPYSFPMATKALPCAQRLSSLKSRGLKKLLRHCSGEGTPEAPERHGLIQQTSTWAFPSTLFFKALFRHMHTVLVTAYSCLETT